MVEQWAEGGQMDDGLSSCDVEGGDAVKDEAGGAASDALQFDEISDNLHGCKAAQLMLPLSRVKRLIKSEGGVQLVTAEANILITKATELFLECFVEGAYERMIQDNRFILRYADVAHAVASDHRLDFLTDIVPPKVPVSKLPLPPPPQYQPPPLQSVRLDDNTETQNGNGIGVRMTS